MRFPDDVPVLTDGVVTLRAHGFQDVEAVFEQCNDPVSQEWTTVPVPYSRENALGFVTEVIPASWAEGHAAFAVEARDDDGTPRFCGTVELRDMGNRRAEIAYGAHPWARGRGIMHRALRLLVDWGFHDRRLRVLIWLANRGNWTSRRAAWRLGFSCDGTLARWLPQRGDLLDGWIGVLHVDDPPAPHTDWLTTPVLDGDAVRLRPFRDSDVPRVVEACSDARTAFWLSRIPQPFTADHAREWMLSCSEHLAAGDAVTWAVADPASDQVIGAINAFEIEARSTAEIGWWVHPDARGRGVATEASRLVIGHCFAEPGPGGGLGLLRLTVSAGVGNTASRHAIESNGFSPYGIERAALRLGDGTRTDLAWYDLLLDEHRRS